MKRGRPRRTNFTLNMEAVETMAVCEAYFARLETKEGYSCRPTNGLMLSRTEEKLRSL
jgi:hypothetical protein